MVKPGKINQIIGPVVDVLFEGAMPPVYEKLCVQDSSVTLEVFSHIRKGVVRCIALTATEGLYRGMTVLDTGSQLVCLWEKAFWAGSSMCLENRSIIRMK